MKKRTDNYLQNDFVESLSRQQNAAGLESLPNFHDTSECCFQDWFLGRNPKDRMEYSHPTPARQESFKFCS
jgi:hypothetical protein